MFFSGDGGNLPSTTSYASSSGYTNRFRACDTNGSNLHPGPRGGQDPSKSTRSPRPTSLPRARNTAGKVGQQQYYWVALRNRAELHRSDDALAEGFSPTSDAA